MKYQNTATAILAVASTVIACPIVNKRQYTAITDSSIRRNWLFRSTNLVEIAADEKTHVAFLLKALGSAAVAECQYGFPSTTPAGFIALASVLEGVGVSAYLDAEVSIMNKDYLTAAGSILTVESRHSSYFRASLQESPFPQPFDTPLDFDDVYTLASSFILSCPSTTQPCRSKLSLP